MTLWEEFFNPQPLPNIPATLTEFNSAWEWIFEKDAENEYVRAGVTLNVIRLHSKTLRKSGVKDSARIAAIQIWKRFSAKMPTRKI